VRTRLVVLSDTHLRPGRARTLPAAARHLLHSADAVLHAGDLVHPDVLDELARYGPVHAVLGNNDLALVGRLPDVLALTVEGVRIALVHDSGPRAGREGRMRRRFPDADVVVFGHSHQPYDGEGLDGQRLFNPGSPTDTRGQPHPTVGVLEVHDGRLVDHRIVAVD